MIAEKSPRWDEQLGKLLVLLVENDYDATTTLKLVGEGIKGQLQQSIVDMNAPPLSPKTIAPKGNAKSLVDTGQMLNSVDYEVYGE